MKKTESHKFRKIVLLSAIAGMTGCVSQPEMVEEEPAFEPTYNRFNADVQNLGGSIFSSGRRLGLYEDLKAHRVGDILTVFLVEQTSGQNSADNNVTQATDMNVEAPTFGGSLRPNMEIDLGSENSFSGQSGTSQSNSLNGNITVTVTGVLANGNLVVEGEKWIRINQAREFIRLQGVVRQADISTNNTLLSTQVADAHIAYGGTGSHGTAPGWAAQFLFRSIWPF